MAEAGSTAGLGPKPKVGVAGADWLPKEKDGWADFSPLPTLHIKVSREALLELALVFLLSAESAVITSSGWRFLGLTLLTSLAISEDLELSIVGQAQEL